MNETIKNKDADRSERRDDELDQGLDETFPASDAPAATQPGGGRHNETRRVGDKEKRERD